MGIGLIRTLVNTYRTIISLIIITGTIVVLLVYCSTIRYGHWLNSEVKTAAGEYLSGIALNNSEGSYQEIEV